MDYSYEFLKNQNDNKCLNELLHKLPFFCAEYISQLRHKGIKTNTQIMYLQDILQFFNYLCMYHGAFLHKKTHEIQLTDLENITQKELEDFLTRNFENNEIMVKRSTINRRITSLKSLFYYLEMNKGFYFKPIRRLKSKAVLVTETNYLNQKEKANFLQYLNSGYFKSQSGNIHHFEPDNKLFIRDVAILYLMLGAGLKVSDIVALNEEDLDAYEGFVITYDRHYKVTKRFFSKPVQDKLLDYLENARKDYLNDLESDPGRMPLFLSTRKRRMSIRSVQYIIEKYASMVPKGKDDLNKQLTAKTLCNTYKKDETEPTIR